MERLSSGSPRARDGVLRYLSRASVRSLVALATFAVILSGCDVAFWAADAVFGPSAHELAQRACNEYAAAIEPDLTRQQTVVGLKRAADAAEEASEMDRNYQRLAGALRGMQFGFELFDIEMTMNSVEVVHDECWEIMEVEDRMREEIERMQQGG